MRFASLLSGGFITAIVQAAIVVNLPEKKLAKRTSVHCTDSQSIFPMTVLFFFPLLKQGVRGQNVFF